MKNILSVAVMMMVGMAFAATPTITNVKAQYLHPWGKVAISYEVKGDIAPETPLIVCAKDIVLGNEHCASRTYLSGDIDTNEGLHRIVWDMDKQGVFVDLKKVVFTILYGCPPYLVIDLSAGKDAKLYPVSYLYSLPTGGWTDEYKTTKLVLRCIKSGSFKMNGSYDVTLTKPYYMGVFEVTQKQYELVTGNKPSEFSGDTLPVEQVSWNAIRGDSGTHNWPEVKTVDANSFMGRLRARTGLTFDLPTEAQWEYACRAGTTTTYYWGDSMNGAYAWYSENSSGETHSVGTRKANAWGLYDMSGNIFELCLDWYGNLSSGSAPVGSSSGSTRVVRGGCWCYGVSCCSSSYRIGSSPSYDYCNLGFRLACSAGL